MGYVPPNFYASSCLSASVHTEPIGHHKVKCDYCGCYGEEMTTCEHCGAQLEKSLATLLWETPKVVVPKPTPPPLRTVRG